MYPVDAETCSYAFWRESLSATSPTMGMMFPFLAEAAASLSLCSLRPMMKTFLAITVVLAYLIALTSGEEAPANDATIETKAENYGGKGGFRGGRGYGGRGRYKGGFHNGPW